MGRIITVASGKGGVGKTTFVSNFVASLSKLGKSVVAVDGNLTTPNLGLHLGVPLYPKTLQDVLAGDARLKQALYQHELGFSIMPADISLRRLTKVTASDLISVLYKLADGFEFVIVDAAAGLGREALAAIDAADELITITNPEMPAMVEALKLGRISEKTDTKNLGVVVNRYRKEKGVPTPDEIKSFLDMDIIGIVPEDSKVRQALAKKQPIVHANPRAPSAKKFKEIASTIAGLQERQDAKIRIPEHSPIFSWLKK